MTNHIRDLRGDRGWSQGELAERLGVSRQSVNAIETGKYDPSLPLAFKIAELFDLKIEDVFEPEEKRTTRRAHAATEGRSKR
jgi:putative transcriptional regulator